MVAITGHFDGKVIVPDEPLDLPRNQRLIVHVQAVDTPQCPRGTAGADLLSFAGTISSQDLDAMTRAIDEDCERIDPDAD